MKKYCLIFITLAIVSSCSVSRKSISSGDVSIQSLKYLGKYEVPFNQQFKGTTVGGLSGIDYDSKRNVYYIISDDRSSINPARFYTAKINISKDEISNVEFVNVTTLLQPNGTTYPDRKIDPSHAPDPESIRYNPITDQLVWTSEGEKITNKTVILEQPAITAINTEGKYIDTFQLPKQTRMLDTEQGLRQNGVFEGLTFANNFKTMYVSIEEPLYEDGPRAGLEAADAFIRIIKYDVERRTPKAQYAYRLEPVAHAPKVSGEFMINGIPEILSIGKEKLLVIERSFSTGIQACTIRVFVTDLGEASDISGIISLREQYFKNAAAKKLLINMDDLGIYIDNIEGVTFGPNLPNGHRTLIFISDNNFDKNQKTQFLLFEVN